MSAGAGSQPAVSLEDVTVTRRVGRGRELTVLDRISFTAAEGEVVALVGPSGCGKSTLLEVICGMLPPQSGTVRADPTALMPQQDMLLPWASALDNAGLALRAEGRSRAEARSLAEQWFPRLGLAGFEQAFPHELSGGMRQRVAYARTLLAGRPVIALDEPFSSLDALSRLEARDWLASVLGGPERTALLVTHDVEEAVLLSDRVIVLSPQPARVVQTFDVAIAAPRHRADATVVRLREEILSVIGASA